nr:calmodulin-binding transcription activator 3-like isoform X1 [Ipomoea batatas]
MRYTELFEQSRAAFMATESRRYGLNAQLDIDQILLEAQHRWLRPAEICEILKNYQKFQIAPEPPNTPPSMIL